MINCDDAHTKEVMSKLALELSTEVPAAIVALRPDPAHYQEVYYDQIALMQTLDATQWSDQLPSFVASLGVDDISAQLSEVRASLPNGGLDHAVFAKWHPPKRDGDVDTRLYVEGSVLMKHNSETQRYRLVCIKSSYECRGLKKALCG
jgi:hypothetical protein